MDYKRSAAHKTENNPKRHRLQKRFYLDVPKRALVDYVRAYNIPDVDLLEAIYIRTTACMDPEDARCAIITFLTGVIQGGASSPRIVIFVNALLEHLTCTGQALGISDGIAETEQFNNVIFMDDITSLAQDNAGAQILLNATQEFEAWSNMRLNLSKTVVVDIDGGSGHTTNNRSKSSKLQKAAGIWVFGRHPTVT